MKKIIAVLMAALVLCTLTLLAGCDNSNENENPDEKATDDTPIVNIDDEPVGGGLLVAPVIADMSRGTGDEELIKEMTHYSYVEITPEDLINTLSDWTHLDFKVTISYNENGDTVVDWAADSTLVAGLGDREQNQEFFMYDNESLRWFMMDSLWRTLNQAFGATVYYTMDGGKELSFDELSPINSFSPDSPYMGEAFYLAHDDVKGEMGVDVDKAMDLLSIVLSDRLTEETALVYTNDDEINGHPCVIIAFGKNTDEKFTAEEHYAVTDTSEIYILNIITNEYEPFAMG